MDIYESAPGQAAMAERLGVESFQLFYALGEAPQMHGQPYPNN
jgi:hypothetical protein